MQWMFSSEVWISLATLTLLEVILGIDNIIVISILSGKLPRERQKAARSMGLMLALVTRVLLLLSIVWLARLTNPLFTIFDNEISVRDIILISGGLFLMVKATHEIHGSIEKGEEADRKVKAAERFHSVIIQIVLLDIVFSLDSVITAVGMASKVGVMIAAVIIAIVIMLLASGTISDFIHRHPSLKILALSFLMMVGVTLTAEGAGFHIPKGYIYFAMGFSGLVETINLAAGHRKKARAIEG